MYLVRTLHCNPLPLVNATKKKKCWPWETQRLDFEGVFLEAWVCNWVERQGGWLWWCSRKHKGECVCVWGNTRIKKEKNTDIHKQRDTHTHVKETPGTGWHQCIQLNTYMIGSRTSGGNRQEVWYTMRFQGSRWLLITQTDQNEPVLPPRSPPVLQCSPLQDTSFDGGSTRPTNLQPQDIISSMLALKLAAFGQETSIACSFSAWRLSLLFFCIHLHSAMLQW